MSAVAAPPSAPWTRRRPRYLAIAQTAAIQAIAYRLTLFSSIVGNFFWIALLYYLWQAAFAQTARIGDFSWEEMRTYILLAFGINALIGFPIVGRMMQTIRTGDVVVDMVRPLNYLRALLAQTVGLTLLEGVFGCAIVLALGVLVDAVPPVSAPAAGLFVASVAMAFVTKFLIVFSVSLLCFWTINAIGLNWAQLAVINVLSGMLVPIQFLPGWLRPLAEWSPLRGIVATPAGVYLGQYEGWGLLAVLALQAAWLVVLWVLADRAWPRAFRAADIQGG